MNCVERKWEILPGVIIEHCPSEFPEIGKIKGREGSIKKES